MSTHSFGPYGLPPDFEIEFQGFVFTFSITNLIVRDSVAGLRVVDLMATSISVKPVIDAKADMGKLPLAITLLNHGTPADTRRLLIAAILHTDDEMLEITESELNSASNYKLITTVMDDNTVVLVAEPK